MAVIDQALDRLRRHVEGLWALVRELQAPDAVAYAFGERLAKTARDAGEDVETLRILAVTAPAETPRRAAPMPPTSGAAAGQGGSQSAGVFSTPDQDPNALWADAIAAHDRDHADGKDGLPPHRAGELPDRCGACEVFAALTASP